MIFPLTPFYSELKTGAWLFTPTNSELIFNDSPALNIFSTSPTDAFQHNALASETQA
jgi:putative AlgH/UPF0301 family transcriptional regulator